MTNYSGLPCVKYCLFVPNYLETTNVVSVHLSKKLCQTMLLYLQYPVSVQDYWLLQLHIQKLILLAAWLHFCFMLWNMTGKTKPDTLHLVKCIYFPDSTETCFNVHFIMKTYLFLMLTRFFFFFLFLLLFFFFSSLSIFHIPLLKVYLAYDLDSLLSNRYLSRRSSYSP